MRAVFLTLCAAAALATALLLIGRLAGIEHPSIHKTLTLRGHSFRRQDRLHALLWGLGAVALTWGVSVLYCAIFGDGLSWSALWDAWKKYDGYHYLGLAERGYAGYTEYLSGICLKGYIFECCNSCFINTGKVFNRKLFMYINRRLSSYIKAYLFTYHHFRK